MPGSESRRTPGPTLCQYTSGSSAIEGQQIPSGTPARMHWAAFLYGASKSQYPVVNSWGEVASALLI